MERPAKTLPSEPAVTTIDQCELAIEEMAWLDSEKRRIDAEYDQKAAELRTKLDEQLTMGPKANRVSFGDRYKQLLHAVTTFASETKAALLSGLKTKTRAFTHGAVSFAEQPESIKSTDEAKTVDQMTTDFLTKTKLAAAVHKAVKRVKITFADGSEITADKLLRVDLAFSLTRIKDEKKSGSLDDARLKELGLQIVRPAEKIAVKVNQ